MTYKNSRLIVIAHLAVIILVSSALGIFLSTGGRLFVPLTLCLLLIGALLSLLRYLEKTTNDFTRFLLAIKEGIFMDESQLNKSVLKNNFTDAMNEITREFSRVSFEKELQYQYLKTLNENIGAGILAVNSDDSIRTINPVAKKIVRVADLRNLRDLRHVDEKLSAAIANLRPEQSEIVKITSDQEEIQLSIQMKEVVLSGENVRIFLLQNINNELAEKELQAWQELTRVLTHEIMNSVTPITSLAKAAQEILSGSKNASKNISELTRENLDDIHQSVDTIVSRSQNLISFVSGYRAFTKPIALSRSEIDVMEIVGKVIALFQPDIESNDVVVDFVRPEGTISSKVDIVLMEQAVINIFKNALEAVRDQGLKKITIRVSEVGEKISLQISDNGPGIPPDVVEKIFVPFYTTRKGGTGVGLSLARQIMQAHRGTIRVRSNLNEGTTFFLEWRNQK
jgi:two-component system, NtrC family, nitrogen regulation sensor histidine kinase NtrY